MLNSNGTNVKTYVGTDGKIHFIDWTGADTVLNFSKGGTYTWSLYLESNGVIKYTLKIGGKTAKSSSVGSSEPGYYSGHSLSGSITL